MDDEFDFEDLTEEEINEILIYSESEDNFQLRYVIACKIISNMIEEMKFETFSSTEMVDMTFCKMLLDGYVEVEEEKRQIH